MNHSSSAPGRGTFGPPPRFFRNPIFLQRVLEVTALVGLALQVPLLIDPAGGRQLLLLLGLAMVAVAILVRTVQEHPGLLLALTVAGCLIIGLVIPNVSAHTGALHLTAYAALARNAPFLRWPLALASAVLLEAVYLGTRLDWTWSGMIGALVHPTTAVDTASKLVLATLSKSWHDLNVAVRRSAMELTALTGSSGDLMVLLDRNGIIRSVNAACRPVLGYAPDEVTGRTCRDTMCGPDATAAEIARLIDAGQPVYHVMQHAPRKDGARVWIEWNLEPVPELDALLCVGRDVTQRGDFPPG
ncbi:MAG TPA: PAS domain S-box protein [Symbiobacteriaceae bacterium]|nr:PAS domain S-box protein [Symbiobacteriaceae bacterium]